MSNLQKQSGFVPLVILAIIGALGVGIATVNAADNAKPGDVLFAVDTAIEDFRLNLTRDSATELELRTQFAAERVAEVEEVLQERDVDAQGLDIALANLTSQKADIANLIAQNQELKSRAKALDDLFEQKEKQLEAAFKDAKRELKAQKVSLKIELAQAKSAGDSARADSLRAQIAQIEERLDTLEAQEEAAEEALEAEEEKLEAQLEAEEKALEEKEEALEDEEDEAEEDDEDEEDEDDDKD